MTKKSMELGPLATELLIALAGYVAQHGNVAKDARYAALLLLRRAGVEHVDSNAVAVAKLTNARLKIERESR